MGMQANHAYKMVNFLIGSIDTPGGHIGVTLDDKWEDFNHIVPGENGQIEGIPHQLGHVPPFSYPSNEFHLFSHFPVGVHPPHLNLEVFLNKQKYGIEFDPDVMVVCHSNPLWAMQGPRTKWFEFMKSMRFVVAIDIIPTETTDFADVILPTTDALESWNMTMIEPPHTEGMCLRQPATEPLYDVKSEEDIFYELSERLGVLESYNDMVNMICGFDHSPNLMLERDKKYTDKEIARRKGLLWNGKDLDWYIEHGHSVTERRPDKWYRPWQGMRLLFYIEDMLVQRDKLKAKMEELDVPYRHDWQWDDYSPLPTALLDPIHTDEPPEYDLYGIFFKDIQINFGESLTNPWIKDIVYRDPVHTALLLNTQTAAKKGLKAGDILKVESPYGCIYGRLGTTEAMHPDTLAVSNSLSRVRNTHRNVRHAGGHFNDLLPYNLRHTDAVTGQPDTATRLKITRLDDWPEELKLGKSVYDVVDDVAKGKGAL
jgi:anaerobic selenocysteine-containing dehydrogenase